MSDTLQQPGLNSLSKSFEPAALEAHWGPEWERRGYAVAGHRGSGAAVALGVVMMFAFKPDPRWTREDDVALEEELLSDDSTRQSH